MIRGRKVKLKAFTLLELLIVMGIIALMSGLGIYGLVRFQANARLESSFNDVLTSLKSVQNMSKNSTAFNNQSAINPTICSSNGVCVPDYYGIRFNSTGYSIIGCLVSTTNIICPDENVIEERLVTIGGVSIEFSGQQCEYLVFQRLTSDIKDVIGSPTWSESGNSLCNLRLFNDYGDQRIIEINILTNSISDVRI